MTIGRTLAKTPARRRSRSSSSPTWTRSASASQEVLADGRLRLEKRGGLTSSVWEAQAALVHGDRGPVPRRLRAARGLVDGRPRRAPRQSADGLSGGRLGPGGRGARHPRGEHGHHAETDVPHRSPPRARPRLRRPRRRHRPAARPAADRSRQAPPEGDLRLVGRRGGGPRGRQGARGAPARGSPRSTPSTPSSPRIRPSNRSASPTPGSARGPCCGRWTTATSRPAS